MIGKTISHYKILEKIGGGGMGVVYKAQDLNLDRFVALKFLPPNVGQDEEEKIRFIHEAKAASSLDHANICTIYEIDESEDGQLFIAMANYEGETLKDKIEKGPLKIEEALNLGIQIGEGLARAHEASITHRDIKPANIMVTKREVVKILDFGLAKTKGRTLLTRKGTTLGTTAYMSPEQVRGEELDNRTDIWSMGVIIYEMVIGQSPFKGEYDQAVMYSIVNEEPEPMTGLRTGVPLELERITNKALIKNKDERYQNLADLLVDLKALKKNIEVEEFSSKSKSAVQPVATRGDTSEATVSEAADKSPLKKKKRTGAVVITLVAMIVIVFAVVFLSKIYRPTGEKKSESDRKMIVVLPFENLGSPEDEYFADGITEEITSRLASVRRLGVISRTSAIQYKNTEKSIKDIGKELGVSHVLEGTVRWEKIPGEPSRVRVTPQLIRVSDDTHLWTDRYDEELDRIFDVQSNIAQQIIGQLDITLVGSEKETIEAKPTENMTAYQLYLKGLEAANRLGVDSETETRLAIGMFQQAIYLDPDFALAYAKLAKHKSRLYFWGYDRTEKNLQETKDAVDRAFALRSKLPEAYLALGYYYYYGFLDFENALKSFHEAEKLIPNDSEILISIAYIWRRQGKFKEAIANQEMAIELTPTSQRNIFQLILTHLWARNYQRGIELCDRMISMDPTYIYAYSTKAWCLLESGDFQTAFSLLDKMPGKETEEMLFWRALIDFIGGRYKESIDKYSLVKQDVYNGGGWLYPISFAKGEVYEKMGKIKEARDFYLSALETMKEKDKAIPNNHEIYASLGQIYGKLGDKEKAIRYGERAVEMFPLSKDAMKGFWPFYDLAFIYTDVGEHQKAIDKIEYLLSIDNLFSAFHYQIHPGFKPLHVYPRFKEVLAKYTRDEKR
jgi:serine/threonine protein kinase/predicted Zn-dependent protease